MHSYLDINSQTETIDGEFKAADNIESSIEQDLMQNIEEEKTTIQSKHKSKVLRSVMSCFFNIKQNNLIKPTSFFKTKNNTIYKAYCR